jgi:hypothetical protein
MALLQPQDFEEEHGVEAPIGENVAAAHCFKYNNSYRNGY